MTSQITSLTIVYSAVYSKRIPKETSKLRVTDLCEGKSPVTGEFPAQGTVTRKMFPFDDVIMSTLRWTKGLVTRDNWAYCTLYHCTVSMYKGILKLAPDVRERLLRMWHCQLDQSIHQRKSICNHCIARDRFWNPYLDLIEAIDIKKILVS